MESEILETPWVVGDDDFTNYACEKCAREYATERGLTFENPYSTTDENPNGYAYCDIYGQGESDTPWSCDCGQWLSVNLNADGHEYVRENDLPQFVKDYYAPLA